MAKVIDEGIDLGKMNAVWRYGIILLIFALFQLITGFVCAHFHRFYCNPANNRCDERSKRLSNAHLYGNQRSGNACFFHDCHYRGAETAARAIEISR